jgi:hypothetical protein
LTSIFYAKLDSSEIVCFWFCDQLGSTRGLRTVLG